MDGTQLHPLLPRFDEERGTRVRAMRATFLVR